MKRLIPFIFLLMSAVGANAQIAFNPDSLSVSVSVDTSDFVAAFEVTNNYSSAVSFWWKLIRDDDFPAEWVFQICDSNTCYFEGVDKCPAGNPNIMNAGVSNDNFSIKIKPHEVGANTLMYFKIYSDSDCTNEIASLPVHVNVGTVSVGQNLGSDELAIFPNPTIDKFMLKNSKGVDQVEIYNIAGKKVKTFKSVPGREYGVEELRTGIYLVRFVDKREKVVKVLRLSKR
jgi:hypothetical protein